MSERINHHLVKNLNARLQLIESALYLAEQATADGLDDLAYFFMTQVDASLDAFSNTLAEAGEHLSAWQDSAFHDQRMVLVNKFNNINLNTNA